MSVAAFYVKTQLRWQYTHDPRPLVPKSQEAPGFNFQSRYNFLFVGVELSGEGSKRGFDVTLILKVILLYVIIEYK